MNIADSVKNKFRTMLLVFSANWRLVVGSGMYST